MPSLKLSTTTTTTQGFGFRRKLDSRVTPGTTHAVHYTTTTRPSTHVAAAANAHVIDHDQPSSSLHMKRDIMPFPLSLSSLDMAGGMSTSSSSSLARSNHWSTTTFDSDRQMEMDQMEASWGWPSTRESGSEWGGFPRQSDDAGSHARDVREEPMGGLRRKRSRAPTATTRVQDQGRAKASYPCPFRKRNPARFNVRDHETCAREVFGSIGDLRYVVPLSCTWLDSDMTQPSHP